MEKVKLHRLLIRVRYGFLCDAYLRVFLVVFWDFTFVLIHFTQTIIMKDISSNNISIKSRVASMFLDHIIMFLIAVAFLTPAILHSVKVDDRNIEINLFSDSSIYYGIIGFALYFCKDVFNGRSISKRIFKLVVVDVQSGEIASPIRCFIRNITCVIWPVELFITLSNPQRRLGDKLAGTKIVCSVEEVHTTRNVRVLNLILALLMSYFFVLFIFFIGS